MLTILWAFFILVLCIIPGKDLPSSNIWQIDKLAHFLLYLILAFLGLAAASSMFHKTTWLILAACFFYGFAIECIQGLFLTDRFFDWNDILANSFGGLVGVGIFHLVKKYIIQQLKV